MNNAEKFKKVFGIYATELWAMPEENFLRWLNGLNEEAEGLTEDRWVPVTERLPEEEGCYLVTVKNDHERRYSKTAWYSGDGWFARQDIIAWRSTPEPYTEEES